jgi:hypothetical protein
MIVDTLKAIIELGLPLALLSWLIFMRLFVSGELDRQSDRKSIERGVKKIKKSFKSEKKKSFAEKSKTDFGSGFYGLAALWTFLVIELSELIDFVFNFPGLDVIFGDGLISFLFNLGMNQLGNLISAFVWFSYWDGSVLIWVLVAYAGYYAGIEAARRNLKVSKETLLERVRRRSSD